MRKLLVASQQSGVGKTTTSINLAAATAMAGARVLLLEADSLSGISTALKLTEHPDRRPLRTCGVELPGVLCCGVVPNLDVISPYEEGGCSDDHLDQVLQLIGARAFEDQYDCLVINAPPFLGGRPAPLLAACEEYLIVMQAESLAPRTLPAFTELIHRAAQQAGVKVQMRGLLLTLPEGETVGGRCEREMRGRFGTRVLRQVIPHDEEVPKAQLFGHVLVHASPESPAAVEYRELAAALKLAGSVVVGRGSRSVDDLLVMAAPAVRPLTTRRPEPLVPRKSRAGTATPRVPSPPPTEETPPAPEPARSQPPVPPRTGPRRPVRQTPAQPPAPVVAAPTPVPTPPAPATPEPSLSGKHLGWAASVALAIAAGAGLRFVPASVLQSNLVVPLAVGVATAAGVGLGLWVMAQQNKDDKN